MIISRLETILTSDEMRRLKIINHPSGIIQITADVHGMKCYQARRFINNVINTVHREFKLNIIHGYTHGTAIKEMLAQNFTNNHISAQFSDPVNQGITHMLIAA